MEGVPSASLRSRGRRYGFSCLICRRRKIKCDGNKPACTNCSKSNESCIYKESPAFIGHLSERLRDSQARVRELEQHIKELAVTDPESRDIRLAALVLDVDQDQEVSSSGSPENFRSQEASVSESVRYDGGAEFSVDEDGKQQYFGATSRFHPIPEQADQLGKDLETDRSESSEIEEYHRKWHISNARFQQSWERISHSRMRDHTDIDPNLCSTLLDVYWTWQAPLHNCVYRPCFFRDMALGGPYFSLFLLHVIFAHACRHMPDDDHRFFQFQRGEYFLEKARLLLIDEIKADKPKVPTIQGLLILGGRQCAIGKSSEGWLYTGMAIRMITDLGLHLQKGKMIKECEPDDLEVRKRLYLSVYAWDKSISLCLGRPPSLKNLPYPPSSLYDLTDNEDIWQPPRVFDTDKTFPATKCYSTQTFIHFCRLSEIIDQSYDTVYNGKADNIKPNAIFSLEDKLRVFHQNLPDCLRVENSANKLICIPPHILCLNILYRTMLILIFRPFFMWQWRVNLRDHPLALRAQEVCAEEAANVNELIRAYGRLFNFQYQSYLISYCVYTAATIDVRLIRHEDKRIAHHAADRLVITLRMLETEVKQTPGIKRSIDIIRSHLDQQCLINPRSLPTERNQNCVDSSNASSGLLASVYGSQIGQNVSYGPVLFPNQASHLHDHVMTPEIQSRLSPGNSGGMQSTIENQMPPTDDAWINWNIDDWGGGFVPDMSYWGNL